MDYEDKRATALLAAVELVASAGIGLDIKVIETLKIARKFQIFIQGEEEITIEAIRKFAKGTKPE